MGAQDQNGKNHGGLFRDFQNRNVKKMWPLVMPITIILLVMIFMISSYSRVKKVTVSGNEIVSDQQIKAFSPVKKGTSLFAVWGKTDKLAQSLKQRSRRMQSVKMKLVNFNQVKIKVEEYPTIGYLFVHGGYQPILKSGVIIKGKVLNPKAGFPVLKKFQNPKKLRRTIKQYRRISPPVRAVMNTISFSPTKSNPDRIFIQMSDGNKVYASISTFGDKMDYYPSISSKLKVKSVINLEVGAYSYPIPQKQTSTKTTSVQGY
ncbi:cell division protein FtsQ/DivIB [Lentilactobacillus buchneri]|uniref:Cell division protein DivIB n=1 Tax=Lentilactobacillus buchneri (strain NRRL B-30929) TaxID=511437 RepID=DIVIB_LENBN|nr:FtsQ-type POTRA domain-containing protein [Lentilactobacillus buchneri]F4FSX0.1 RecName: Full=Cell division protein DivIB [Lentilactobacillus buchneri NRRL B-30929]AEB72957.1 cell division protein FtsQ [Lentilactobacillus buchneri NRRL B-30929]MQM82168.1 cell division protein DivIB [Lentilactobacillus buchneri]